MRQVLTDPLFIATALALGGCATPWTVDSQVHSHSRLASVPPGAGYRFDRLPSQQAAGAAQTELEAMAAPALAAVGLRRDAANPRYTVEISAHVTGGHPPWADPWLTPGWGVGISRGWHSARWYRGGGWGPAFPPPATPWYDREVGVVLRELPSHQVVYETRARNQGPYPLDRDVLPVMFQAALQGFPTPPAGERLVNLTLPPKQPAPAGPAPAPARP